MALDTDIKPDHTEEGVARGPSFGLPRVTQWHSIGFKIMLANALALLLLGSGVMMFSAYKKSLVYTELSLLEDEALLWSRSLSQDSGRGLTRAALQADLIELSRISQRQAVVFNQAGQRLATSYNNQALQDTTRDSSRSEPIVFHEGSDVSFVTAIAQFLLYLFPIEYDLPLYPEDGDLATLMQSHAPWGGNGQVILNAWVDGHGQLVFTAAAALAAPTKKIGTLLLIKKATQTEEAFQLARLDMARILLAALVITLTFTLYVAFMVARPLNQLARSAAAMRLMRSREQLIPDLSARGDEIGALSVVLRETTQALWERMDGIEHFAADVAHELKNPLTSLRSALETLPKLSDPVKQQKLLSIMAEDMTRLDRLITDIARASRLDAELSRDHYYPVDLAEVLGGVLRGYALPDALLHDASLPAQMITRVRDVRIEISASPATPKVYGSPVRLHQVIDNLISNALSFSPVQGRVIVVLGYDEDVHQVRLMVDDQGPGIPDAKLETVFSRFYSERPQEEAFGTHSGLGLAIARQIVNSLGGKIWAENRRDDQGKVCGARFIVTLPALDRIENE